MGRSCMTSWMCGRVAADLWWWVRCKWTHMFPAHQKLRCFSGFCGWPQVVALGTESLITEKHAQLWASAPDQDVAGSFVGCCRIVKKWSCSGPGRQPCTSKCSVPQAQSCLSYRRGPLVLVWVRSGTWWQAQGRRDETRAGVKQGGLLWVPRGGLRLPSRIAMSY